MTLDTILEFYNRDIKQVPIQGVLIPRGRRGRNGLPKLSHFSLFQAKGEALLHRIYKKNIPKDYHLSSKFQKMDKTSPCFKVYKFQRIIPAISNL